MFTLMTRFAKDTDGMVSIDWIGLVATLALSATSAVGYVCDSVVEQSEAMSVSIQEGAPCPDELHFAHKDNNLAEASDYYPPQP